MSLSPSSKPQPQPPKAPPLSIPPPLLPSLQLDSDLSSILSSPTSSLSSLPMSPRPSASIHTFPPLPPRSTPTTPTVDPSRSCPCLPNPEQPSLTRHASVPVRRLPLLDLNSLPSLCPTTQDLRTPRRRLEAIGTALSRFRPYLFVGSDASARDMHTLRKNNVTHIINLAGNTTPNFFKSQFKYLTLFPRDDHKECIDDLFDVCNKFIDDARCQQGACAVLCRQGVSRSATIAIAYVMCDERISVDEAMRDLRVSRPIVAPNRGFVNALTRLDRHLRQGRRRAWVGMVKNCDDGISIARQVGNERVCDEECCYILERALCDGIIVWRGQHCPDRSWIEGVAIAKRLAERQKQTLTSLEKNGHRSLGTAEVLLCSQAKSADVEEEMRRACRW